MSCSLCYTPIDIYTDTHVYGSIDDILTELPRLRFPGCSHLFCAKCTFFCTTFTFDHILAHPECPGCSQARMLDEEAIQHALAGAQPVERAMNTIEAARRVVVSDHSYHAHRSSHSERKSRASSSSSSSSSRASSSSNSNSSSQRKRIVQPIPDCAICMTAMAPSNTHFLPCFHRFHVSCIFKWGRQPHAGSSLCPVCKHPMKLLK
jgi:hypothetical protein